jgi:hypothetical protein
MRSSAAEDAPSFSRSRGEVVSTWAVSSALTSSPSRRATSSISSAAPSQAGSAAPSAVPSSGSSAVSRGNQAVQSPPLARPRTRSTSGSAPLQLAPTMVAAAPSITRALAPWSLSRRGSGPRGTSRVRVSPPVTEGSACTGAARARAPPPARASGRVRAPARSSPRRPMAGVLVGDGTPDGDGAEVRGGSDRGVMAGLLGERDPARTLPTLADARSAVRAPERPRGRSLPWAGRAAPVSR